MTNRRERPSATVPAEEAVLGSRGDDVDVERNSLLIQRPESGGASSPTPRQTPTKMIYFYMFLFFTAMIGHEVALEAASTSFGHLDALASSVTCFQFSFCVLVPLLLSRGKGLEALPKTRHELLPYIRLSLLVFGATGLATQAVRYVTYPTKVVFKSAKLIPTMAVASIWQGQRYRPLEYFAACLLCAGAAGYAFGGSGNSKNNNNAADNNDGDDGSDSHAWGIFLLLASVICDAIVPNYQKLLLNQGISAAQLMININTVGTGAVLTYMLLTGQLWDSIQACQTHPSLLVYLTCVGVGLSTAVWAYTKLIEATSSVVAVAVSTLRKVGTIVLSYVLFPKPLLTIHIFSGLLVLTGMVLSSVAKERSTAPSNNNNNSAPENSNSNKH